MNEAEAMWEKFIAHLNVKLPLGTKKAPEPHRSFIGGIDKYKAIFLEANKETNERDGKDAPTD